MSNFALGMLVGGVLAVLLLALLLRLLGRSAAVPMTESRPGNPELILTLNRDLLQRLIDDSLRDVEIPLVTLRDPRVQLEPDAILVVRLRGDTVLLGGQAIVLRMRLVPATAGVGVVTESADVGILGNVAGPLTNRLDELINAELAQRLAFASEFEVLAIDGTTEEVTITAQLRP